MDMLLFDLLQELIYSKDADQLLLPLSRVSVRRQNSDFELSTDVFGETIDPERHSLTVDVKAVTLHRFQVIQITKGWKVTVISVIQCGSCRIRVMMNRAGLHV
jgi:SHS2 domain-containing protein